MVPPGATPPSAAGPGTCGDYSRSWHDLVIRSAKADCPHPDKPDLCTELMKVNRECELGKVDKATGLPSFRCKERRETFLLCQGREPRKVSAAEIETQMPIVDGQVERTPPSGQWTLWRPVPDDAAFAEMSDVSEAPSTSGSGVNDRRLSPGRSGRGTWDVRADDGAGAAASPLGVLPPHVGQAVEDIISFADEMQRQLAEQGYTLLRQGQEDTRPGFFARLWRSRVKQPTGPVAPGSPSWAPGPGSSSTAKGAAASSGGSSKQQQREPQREDDDPLARFAGSNPYSGL